MNIGMTEAMIKIGDEIWTVPAHYNFLVAINIYTGRTRYICQITEQRNERLYTEIVKYKDEKLFFVPMSADSIVVYDLKTESLKHISIDIPEEYVNKTHYKPDYKLSRARFWKSDIYFFPCSFPAIIKMNPDTYEMTLYSDWVEILEKKMDVVEEVYFRDCFVKMDTVYMASCCSNVVLEFNFVTKKSCLHVVGEKPFSTITWFNDWFYLSSKQGNELIRLKNLDDEKYEVIPGTDRFPAVATLLLYGKLFVISNKPEETYCLGERNDLSNIDLDDELILDVLKTEDGFWYVGEKNSILRGYNKKQGMDEQKICLILDDEVVRHVFEKIEDHGLYREGVLRLDDFFELVKSY